MLTPYKTILAIPGALKFSAAGLLARLPMSMVGIAVILMLQTIYGSFALAGKVAAVFVVSLAVGAPQLAKLIDRHGQRKIMLPAVYICSLGILAVLVIGTLKLPPIWLYPAVLVSGLTAGSIGSLVRARWTHATSNTRDLYTAYSLESSLDEVVFVIGPIAATFLSTTVHSTAAIYVVLTTWIIGGTWFLSQYATEPPPHPDTAASHTQKNTANAGKKPKKSLLNYAAVNVMLIVFIAAGGILGAGNLSIIAIAEENQAKYLAGAILGAFAAGSMIAGLVYGSINWAMVLWKRFMIGVLLLALGTASLLWVKTLGPLAIFAFLTGGAVAPTIINANSLVQQIVPKNRLTEGLAWMASAMQIGVALGGWFGGRAIDRGGSLHGFHAVMWFALITVFTTLAGLYFLRRDSERPRLDLWPDPA